MNKSSLTICHRWSFTVPILCYILFFIMIWTLSVPLKPNIRIEIPNDTPMELKRGVEDTFEIRMKNSNFNSDKNAEDNLLNEKNEYLINVNNKENINKDQTEILEDVFKKNPKNGVVSWKEYHSYFLKKRGFSKKYVKNHDEKRHKGLERSLKEQIMRDKASWMEAARTNPDTLTVDEFLTFTHPESSATNQLALVDDLYDKFDRDGDELLTEDEFAILQTEGEEETVIVRQDEKERRSEFRKSIDLNGDGKADRRELLHYVAPQSPRHSEHEAEALLALADNDQDNMISLDEILAHPNLFLKSKMVDTARSFHDEF
ncbi:PREDICTED: 45 kDa calcium-binding protein isoform X2 [Nicrophorus vespilloides]|uniref:45 kDa calcium-binding protein isoform X2 n=1 Tax=Nicrophorus vespilloides TaxID=110193 RepID=A0ABM1ND81_NICVS|nr:PREDICTED: 45 kDa calcium-binding protein isoform X2 [Nicrophorus vespilloides]